MAEKNDREKQMEAAAKEAWEILNAEALRRQRLAEEVERERFGNPGE